MNELTLVHDHEKEWEEAKGWVRRFERRFKEKFPKFDILLAMIGRGDTFTKSSAESDLMELVKILELAKLDAYFNSMKPGGN